MRPEYSDEELDDQCEELVSDHLHKKYGQITFPISTEDLRLMVETEAESFGLNADLEQHGAEVEARTEFRRGQRPAVQVALRLAQSPNLENRFRAVLAHQYGHLRFHRLLFETNEGSWLSLFEDPPESLPRLHSCRHNSIAPLSDEDWMEWQAGYVCGALLMPYTALIACVREFRHARDLDLAALSESSLDGLALVRDVARRFQTSWDTARNRLIQQRVLAAADARSMF